MRVQASPFLRKLVSIRLHSTYVHGEGFLGTLGLGNFKSSTSIQLVDSLSEFDVVRVSAGWGHSAAMTSDGNVMIWGRPYDFKNLLRLNNMRKVWPSLSWLVNKTTNLIDKQGLMLKPKQIYLAGEKAVDVKCSAGLTAVVTAEGSIYTQGINRWGQCGIGESKVIHVYEPRKIKLDDQRFTDVALGFQHGLGLFEDGTVYAWGKGERGQLGTDRLQPSNESAPLKVCLPEPIKAIGAGFNHSIALSKEGGRLYIWGKMQSLEVEKSELERTIYYDQLEPRIVDFKYPVVNAACTLAQTFVCTSDGKMYAIGLTADTKEMMHVPKEVHIPKTENVISTLGKHCNGWNTCIEQLKDGRFLSLTLNSDGVALNEHLLPGLELIGGKVKQLSIGWQHQVLLLDK